MYDSHIYCREYKELKDQIVDIAIELIHRKNRNEKPRKFGAVDLSEW